MAVLILAAVPFFLRLGASSLWDSNEAFYAETPREMMESGDYLNPSFNYRPRFNKPPLSYWIVAGSYRAFGVSEWAERLPIALGGLVMIWAAFRLARIAYSLEAGLLSAIALASMPRFLIFSRRIFIDVYVSMFMGLVLLFFMLAEKEERHRRRYLALMYVAAGLGVLTKGPIAVALPALVFLSYLIATRRLGRLREMMLPVGALIVAAIVLPWYTAIYFEHGWGHIAGFILKDNISRYTEPVWGPRRGPFFYVPVMLGDLFPWSLFLALALALWLIQKIRPGALPVKEGGEPAIEKGKSERRRLPGPESGESSAADFQPRLLLTLWVVVIVAFFSLSRNKEDLYILPAYPAAAAIIGGLLARGSARFVVSRGSAAFSATFVVTGLLMAFAGALVYHVFGGGAPIYALRGGGAVGVLVLAGGLLCIALALARKRPAALICLALSVIGANWTFTLIALPDFERYKPVPEACELIRAQAPADALVGYYRFASPSMVFYLGRPIFEYYREEELEEALKSGRDVYCLMSLRDYETVGGSLSVPTYVLASYPVFQVKLKGILDRTGLPQVVLISNKNGASILR
ncbi:MAG TPA: glycosyltransferase family 39 protein [Blastocatellia bacterium]|nr:glycosyltransferase family 39 protein [Blastocatellia bacterium]